MKKLIKQLILKLFNTGFSDLKKGIDENYWANVFNSTIQDSDFFICKSVSPGRWAASYSFLYILYRTLNDFKPKNILEFGLGQSSKLSIQYAKKYSSHLRIIEQNKDWINIFSENCKISEAEKYCYHFEIESIECEKRGKLYKYKNFDARSFDEKFDLCIVDGPWGSDHDSRTEILSIIKDDKLAANFVIIFDDCQRIGEMETVERTMKALSQKGIKFVTGEYTGEKKQILFTTPDNSFLTTM